MNETEKSENVHNFLNYNSGSLNGGEQSCQLLNNNGSRRACIDLRSSMELLIHKSVISEYLEK